jgi:hypothetical protein
VLPKTSNPLVSLPGILAGEVACGVGGGVGDAEPVILQARDPVRNQVIKKCSKPPKTASKNQRQTKKTTTTDHDVEKIRKTGQKRTKECGNEKITNCHVQG